MASVYGRITMAARSSSPTNGRCVTPIRPNDSLLLRLAQQPIPTTKVPLFSTSQSQGSSSIPSPPRGPKPHPASSSSSAAVRPSSASRSPPRDQLLPQLPPKSNESTPRLPQIVQCRGPVTVATVTTAANTLASVVSVGGTRYPASSLHEGTSQDAFTAHERDLISEVNLLRSDPQRYAADVEQHATITQPFVPEPMTLAVAESHAATLHHNLQSSSDELADLMTAKKKEIQQMQSEWAAEDAEKAKKSKKAPPKKQAAVAATPEPAEVEAERAEALSSLEHRYAARQQTLQKSCDQLTEAYNNAVRGVSVLRSTLEALLSTAGPLPSLCYNRGLSLAARELCTTPAFAPLSHLPKKNNNNAAAASTTTTKAHDEADEAEDQRIATEVAAAFGRTGMALTWAAHSGSVSVKQTIYELLMELQNRHSRAALLNPHMSFVGCGWRRLYRTSGPSRSVIALADTFEELSAISSRPHLALDEVRRVLSNPPPPPPPGAAPVPNSTSSATVASSAMMASRSSPKKAPSSPSRRALQSGSQSTVIALQAGCGIDVVEPTSHPIVCGNSSFVALRCAVAVEICASLVPHDAPAPTLPNAATGEVLVQRSAVDSDVVEIRCVLPSRGDFLLRIFGKGTPMCPSGYWYVGSVQLAAREWSSATLALPLPIVTSDFTDRRCTLISPLQGTLHADMPYCFEVVVPHSAYLQSELSRVINALNATQQRQSNAQELSALEAAVQQRQAQRQAALATFQTEGATLTTEVQTQQRELAKKKGKEVEKAKALIVDLEEQLKALEQATRTADALALQAEEELSNYHRRQRQAAAQTRRYLKEKARYENAVDRSAPLLVQLSMDERWSELSVVDDSYTVYRLVARAPKVAGSVVTLFVSGLSAVQWTVTEYDA